MRKLVTAVLMGALVFSGCTAEGEADNTEETSAAILSEAAPESNIPEGEPNISFSKEHHTHRSYGGHYTGRRACGNRRADRS